MRNETWLDALDHELEARGVPAADRAGMLVEAESYLADAGLDPLACFGPPDDYAASLAAAVGARRLAPPERLAGPPMIVARGVTRSRRRRLVLAELDLTVSAGDVVALVGPNGAGKSTLLRILAGLERPDGGTVEVRGSVGYVPQDGGLDPYLKPDEHFELFGAARGLTPAQARSEGRRLAGILGWQAAGAPVAGELSGGTRQKLSVITAMLGDPEVLLLDEPYQGMDADSSRRFWELLWDWGDHRGRAAVVSTHHSDVLHRVRTVVELAGVEQ